MTEQERLLLAEMRASIGYRVRIRRKDRPTTVCRVDDVIQSLDLKRKGRWVAIIDTGKQYTLDIIDEIENVRLADGPYRNWGEIVKVPCDLTRAALMESRVPSIVQTLQKAFPRCFQETPPVPVSWKQLLGKQIEICIRYGMTDREYAAAHAQWHLLEALQFFNIPTVLYWDWDTHRCYPGKEIWGQMIGKKIQQPVYVEYNGIRCIPAHIPFPCGTPNSNHEYQGRKKVFEKWDLDHLGLFALVAADQIVFD